MKTLGFIALAIGCLLTGCGNPRSSISSSSADRIAKIENGLEMGVFIKGHAPQRFTLRARMRHYHVPALSIAFFDSSGVRWTRAYGATPQTLFQAGSISKPVSAVGIMKLVQQHRLTLDQNVNDALRSWKIPQNGLTANRPVTLRELLSHTAGMSVHGFSGYQRGKVLPTLVEVLNGSPPANSAPIREVLPPGKQFQYSGGGYVVALQLVLDTIHKPFASYMRQAVLQPLGMTNSTFEQPLPHALWSRAAVATDPNGKPYPGNWNVYPELTAAGLWTTPTDLAKFAIGMEHSLRGLPGSVISAPTATTMLTPVKNGYGLGFSVQGTGTRAWFGHNGANVGFQALFLAHRYGKGEGVAMMADSDNGSALMSEVLNGVAAAYGWSEIHPIGKAFYPLSTLALDRFTGIYNGDLGKFIISRQGQALLARTDSGPPIVLYPEGANTFFPLDQDVDIQFTFSPSGKVDGFVIPQMGRTKTRRTSRAR